MRCGKCGDTDTAAFVPSAIAYAAATGRQNSRWCRRCQREYYRQRVAEDRDYFLKYQRRRVRGTMELLRAERKKRGCAKCGEKHPACLDFHHVNEADKRFNIAHAASVGKKKFDDLRAEIEKCVVLCSNCHRKLHYDESTGSYRSNEIAKTRLPLAHQQGARNTKRNAKRRLAQL